MLHCVSQIPRCCRIFLIATWSSITLMAFISPSYLGHIRGSPSYTFCINRAQVRVNQCWYIIFLVGFPAQAAGLMAFCPSPNNVTKSDPTDKIYFQ
jgi:hypothetical protein